MLIIDDNYTSYLLPVYEVQEVSVKEALALLKSDQRNPADSLSKHADSCLPLVAGGSSGFQGMVSSSL
ncbi:MAG: hypothetical protein ABFS39_00475 [Pseudomonadota bacterium]